MTQLRIVWLLPDGSTRRRQTLPLLDSATDEDIQNIVNQLDNLTQRNADSAFKIVTTQII